MAVIALLVSLMLALPVAAEGVSLIPQAFYGAVTDADGTAAPAGTIIVASSEGVPLGSITVTVPGGYGGTANGTEEKLIVQGASLVNGAPVEFSIDGVKARETTSFESGSITRLDLSASSALPKERPAPPQGGSGGGSGSGVSGPATTPVVTATGTVVPTGTATPPASVPATPAPTETAVPTGEAVQETGTPAGSSGQTKEALPTADAVATVVVILGVAAAAVFIKKR